MPKFYKSKLNTEYIFIFIILGSLIVDMINGYTRNIMDVATPIGIVFRGIILIPLIISYSKTKLSSFKILFNISFIITLFAMISWNYNQNNFSFSQELKQLLKFFFLLLFLLYIERYQNRISIVYLIKLGSYWGLIAAIVNIYCFVTGSGVKSYGEDFGFGVKAFFNGGNDFGLACLMSLVLSIFHYFNTRNYKSLISILIIIIGTLLIGTRGVIIGVPIIVITSLLYIGVYKDKEIKISAKTRKIISALTSIVLVMGIIKFIIWFSTNVTDEYLLNRMSVEGITNARSGLTDGANHSIKNLQNLELFFGRSFEGSTQYVGNVLGLHASRMIEADVHEVISSYGWVLGLCLLYTFILLLFKSFNFYRKKRNLASLLTLLIFSMIIGHSALAGHVVFNAMITPFFGIFYLVILKTKFNFNAKKYI